MDINQIAEACIQAIADKVKNLNTLNIIVAGKTGVGKSTLINSIFREQLAQTGLGKPVTDHMRKITKEGVPLAIYDTRGFELGKNAQEEVKTEILATIREGLAARDINKAIHCIWYCINTASNRIEDEEIAWLRALAKDNQDTQVPVLIVLTQSFSKKAAQDLKNRILDENLDVIQVVPVLASDFEVDEDIVIKSFGLDILINVMAEALPEELRNTLQNVQIASLESKKRQAQAAVAAATAAAFGEGFSPIPIADCAVIIPTQVAMIASITAIFGLNINKSIIMGFVSSVLGTGGTTLIGKTLAASLLKLIPGLGTVSGGVISGATAGLLTTALGEAYILLMESIYNGEINPKDINTSEGREKLRALFKSQKEKLKPPPAE
ncbi:MAG: DUF697 domain-containing protein [Proteobacteria bacterium]|nr:DUF697 domain-containing protein [Pseudomonadota bacterium]